MGKRLDRRTERYRCSSPGCGAVHGSSRSEYRRDDLAMTAIRLATELPDHDRILESYASEKFSSLYWLPIVGPHQDGRTPPEFRDVLLAMARSSYSKRASDWEP